MMNEQSYIALFSDEMLTKYGLNRHDRDIISFLVKKAIDEKLYTDTKDFHHNLKHVEKVIAYTRMIISKMNNPLVNEEILMYAALYHDIGKTMGVLDQEHGIAGAQEFKKMMHGNLDDRTIEIISLLIYQHASELDLIDFDKTDYNYTDNEKESIQLMSNILKDADALDRNRLNQPAPIGNCDVRKLRTDEAKEVYKLSNSFYKDYYGAIIKQREKETGKKIFNNYELLNQWIQEYNSGRNNMFHASQDPSIELLRPSESTQKGSYVYAGVNPIDCIKMALFRHSTIFPSTRVDKKITIMEIFPDSIEQILGSKYITIYKLPNYKFHEYMEDVTASPNREWVSSDCVEPIEQISFESLDLLNYLEKTNYLRIIDYDSIKDESKKMQFKSFIKLFSHGYIWKVKSLKDNPNILNQTWEMIEKLIIYYSKDDEILNTMRKIKSDVDSDIYTYIEKFKEQNGREPDYDNEMELLRPIDKLFKRKYYIIDEKGKESLNYGSIDLLTKVNDGENLKHESFKKI